MGERNVERVREMFEAFDLHREVEVLAPYVASHVVWHSFPEWPGDSEYHELDGLGRLLGEWTENFDEYRWEVEEVLERGFCVVVLAYHGGRSKGAALPVRDRVAGVYADFDQQGRHAKAWYFLSWDEALEKADTLE